ncbi:glutathione peroxidase [Tautonia plasticadhaerens]|uniref:Glutathione peroxidase n=1 Tax=Tautonia plasticadhaerens TaxID=2527974 RepID=A0A518H6K6_9BACT|nr:glutathione peroxidase [Tautonia plasticadhaerens]QDV36471.1 Hydroperoxy fatty acid reductase gpx1 [Tautonia plasticadhaerens]
MIRPLLATLSLALLLAGPSRSEEEAKCVLDFTVADIEGNEVDLSRYEGEVLMIVNTASYCGYTPQYEGLEELYRSYSDKGFKVLAFPANEFGAQEPGTNAEIRTFCKSNYDVTFPLFSKIVVKGSGIHPLYAFLTDEQAHPQVGGPIRWNFTKFLVDRNGNVVARFEPGDAPKSDKVIDAVEKALAATETE